VKNNFSNFSRANKDVKPEVILKLL